MNGIRYKIPRNACLLVSLELRERESFVLFLYLFLEFLSSLLQTISLNIRRYRILRKFWEKGNKFWTRHELNTRNIWKKKNNFEILIRIIISNLFLLMNFLFFRFYEVLQAYASIYKYKENLTYFQVWNYYFY